MIHRLFTTCCCVGTSKAIVCASTLLKTSSAQGRPSHLSNFKCTMKAEEPLGVVATQALRTHLYRHHYPAHLVSIHCRILRPAKCQSIVRLVANVRPFELSPIHLQCPQELSLIHPLVPSTVLPQIVNPKSQQHVLYSINRTFPGQLSECNRPRRRLDGCKGNHHTPSPNCAKGRTTRLPTFRSCAVLPSRLHANRRCMLAGYGTSHVNR